MDKKVKSIFDFFKKEEVKVNFSELPTVDGITLVYEGELAEGTPFFVVDENGDQIPAPEGQYQVEYEGKLWVISIDAQGVLVGKEEVMSEETEEPTTTEEVMSKEMFDTIIQKVIEDTDARIKEIEAKYDAKFSELANVKESKFKDERKKVEEFKTLSVKEILTKK